VFDKEMETIIFSNVSRGSKVKEENLTKYTKEMELTEITAL
jgi:phosphoglycerate dehydrogenase-like enzyme